MEWRIEKNPINPCNILRNFYCIKVNSLTKNNEAIPLHFVRHGEFKIHYSANRIQLVAASLSPTVHSRNRWPVTKDDRDIS